MTPPPTSHILARGEKWRFPAIRDRKSPPGPLTAAEEFRARFVEEIARLDTARWVAICRRFVANEAALAASRKRIATILSSYISARLAAVKGFQEHTIAFNRWADARRAIRPTTVHLSETPARWQRQRWGEADDQNLHRVGGWPTWIQTPEVLKRCRCRQGMSFLMQLDSELPTVDGQRWRWGSGGVLFVFWCGSCRVDSQVWQCT